MKHPRRTRSGFTLVELLVVIAIIAVLASVVTVAANAAINAAKRAKGSNTANQIKTAVINYYTEYGVYPLPTGSASTDTLYNDNDQGDWQPLSFCLCGNINPGVSGGATQGTSGTVANTRNIPFLTLKKSDVDANGVPLNPFATTTGAAHPYFNIAIDGDYSGIIGDSGADAIPDFTQWKNGTSEGSAPTVKVSDGVAVWACCDPNAITNPNSSTLPNFWVKTY